MHKALHSRDDVESMHVSKNEGGKGHIIIEDVSIQRLVDHIRNVEKDRLEQPEPIRQSSTEWEKSENRNEKKNNCMDISSDKEAKSHTRQLGYG